MRLLVVVGVVILALGSGAKTGANSICGLTLTEDIRLNEDVVCPGDGLTVGTDGLVIDLNGHSIAGPGSGVGIRVTGRANVKISGGTIRNFMVAVQMNTATGVVIQANEFVANNEALDFQQGSVGNTVKENTFRNHAVRAIMLRSDARLNDIKNNLFTQNRIGVLVFGGVDNEIKDNLFSGSSLAGIRFFSPIPTGNTVKDNVIAANVVGIEFAVGPPGGSAAGNELKANTLSTNTCAVKGSSAGNTFKDNQFIGNGTDSCS